MSAKSKAVMGAVDALGNKIGALGDLTSDFLSELSKKYNFDSVKIKETNKKQKLYHTSESKPMISDKELRLIPQSLSTTTGSPDYIFGDFAYELDLPKGSKVAEINRIGDLVPDDIDFNSLSVEDLKDYSPMGIGKALKDFASINNVDAIKVKNVFGLAGGEIAIINPKIVDEFKEFKIDPFTGRRIELWREQQLKK